MSVVFNKNNYDRKSLAEILQRFGTDLKYCAQLITRGYCDEDVYGMRTWFCRTVPSMIDALGDNAHGVPERLVHSQRFNGNEEAASREWQRILRKIAFLLRESDEKTAVRKIDNPYDMQSQTEAYLHFERRKMAYREKCRKEGMRLFSYWFNDLWD